MSDLQLLPCPFCGAHLERSEALSNRAADAYVHPQPDEASYTMCPMVGKVLWSNSPDNITAWNTRAALKDPNP